MAAKPMRTTQGLAESVWALPNRTATRLEVGPGPRVLSVREGRLWLTANGSSLHPALDLWIEAGESVDLASGISVVIEAWPEARFQLLVPPCRGRDSLASRAAGWLARLAAARAPRTAVVGHGA